MKKIYAFIALVFALPALHAQDFSFSFSGSGASNTVTTVKVENITKGISVTMSGNDILLLKGTTGVNSSKINEPFNLTTSPNPMYDACNISFKTIDQGLTAINLYDMSGKLILNRVENLALGQHTYRLSGLKSGIYMLAITINNKTCTSKIVSLNDSNEAIEIQYISNQKTSDYSSQIQESQTNNKLKNSKTTVELAYSAGDHLLVKGYDGIYSSYSVLDPIIASPMYIILFNPCIDYEGRSYPVTQIGGQWWMAENLKTTKLNDGTPLSDNGWIYPDSAAYCNYLNTTDNDIINTYGRLYNWHAVGTGKLCPIGWHVPTQDEWTVLKGNSGGTLAGGTLKEAGTTHWISPNTGAIDLYGFSALPGGWRSSDIFNNLGKYGYYWTSTSRSVQSANIWTFEYNNEYFMSDPSQKTNGFSIRCTND